MESVLEKKLQHQSSTPKKLDINHLRTITKNFSEDQILGRGGFGIVYKGEENGEVVAVKKLKMSMVEIDDKQFMNEIMHAMDICHPNIVRLEGYCYHTEKEIKFYNGSHIFVDEVYRLLCFEYLPNGSLDKYLSDESSGLDWHVRYNIIEGICNGLHCLHEGRKGAPILHLDLKPANILLDTNMVPKIADFGLSRLIGEGKTHTCTINLTGTRGYMAPEYIDRFILSKETDIFSLGVIIIEIVTGHRKYPKGTTNDEFFEVYKKWRRRLQATSNKTSLEEECQQVNRCIRVGLKCMNNDPKRRPNIREVVQIIKRSENIDSCSVTTRDSSDAEEQSGELVYSEWCENLDRLVLCSPEQSIKAMKTICHDLKGLTDNTSRAVPEYIIKDADRFVSEFDLKELAAAKMSVPSLPMGQTHGNAAAVNTTNASTYSSLLDSMVMSLENSNGPDDNPKSTSFDHQKKSTRFGRQITKSAPKILSSYLVRNMKPDLAMACQALMEGAAPSKAEHEEVAAELRSKAGVPVFMMMPLDTVRKDGNSLNRRKFMEGSLALFKSAGVEGIMVEVWWGIAEADGPGQYNFNGYMELMEMARKHRLKVQAVMSFHQCGDSVTIPLPRWVVEEMDKDPDLAYTDRSGRRNYEYVSLGCDELRVLKGRTPIQCYTDFMRTFRDRFATFMGNTIVEIQVGMGPAGELRYPSYPESNGTWCFPGIGEFQCYDRHMLRSLEVAADAVGKPEWGYAGPGDSGSYKDWPEDTGFFHREGWWNTEYGQFFMSWYSQMLLDHGERILSAAAGMFKGSPGVKISVKVAGIHWHYGTRSHAAEMTAGYYNTRRHDGYAPIARMLARHGAGLNVTCVEMQDHEQPQDAQCRPEALVQQVAAAAREAGVGLAGENALPRYDETAHDQVVATAADRAAEERMVAFTYLRMGPDLFQPGNWRRFAAFVKRMSQPGAEAAVVGKGILLDHDTGVVVGETAVVGDNVSILHHVTLGGTGKAVGDWHPKIGDGVLVGAGATILGNVRIGAGAKVGAGSVVLIDVPPRSTAVGNPARLIGARM